MRNSDTVEAIKIVAHRGYAAAYPENTLPAIVAAVDAGVMAVEVDVQFSKDGVPLLLHDTGFGCIANTDKKVFETNIADIKKIAICEKERCDDSSTDVYYCTLDEFADYIQLLIRTLLRRHSAVVCLLTARHRNAAVATLQQVSITQSVSKHTTACH